MAFPDTNISYAHAMAWLHSYIVSGVPNSQARPSGKVHKDGHAILYALT